MSDSEPSTSAIDLNADVGEGFASDLALFHLVTSASISCGAHAGDPAVIRLALNRGARLGVVLGAHPGFPDRESFGRRERPILAREAQEMVLEQLLGLIRMAQEESAAIRFIKPHGALYNQAQRDGEVAHGVVAACEELGLPLLGQPGSMVERWARKQGVPFFTEGFPDRRYEADGSLVPRDRPGAVLTDPREIESQVIELLEQGRFATFCIHGDDPRAVENARLVRRIMVDSGIVARSFLEPIR